MTPVTHYPLGLKADSPHVQNADFLSRVTLLDAEDLDFVIHVLKTKHSLSKRSATFARITFLRFCSLRALTTRALVPPPLTDIFWHAFILFTEDYFVFCERHFGAYMHHRPSLAMKMPDLSDYRDTLDLLEECYGNVDHLRRTLPASQPADA